MKGYAINIEQETLANTNFRKVLYTGKHSQLVLMSLLPNEEIGLESHPDNDQFFRFEKGQVNASSTIINILSAMVLQLLFRLVPNTMLSICPILRI